MFFVDREILAAIRKERAALVALALGVACGVGLAALALRCI